MGTTYIVVSWVDHRARDKGRRPTVREYGTASRPRSASPNGSSAQAPSTSSPGCTAPFTRAALPPWTETSDAGCDRPPTPLPRREPTTP
jgi:hypothetical protein